MDQNPVAGSAAVVSFVGAVITALVSFGVDIDDGQRLAIIGLIVPAFVLVAFVAAWWARARVTPLTNPHDQQGIELVRVDGKPAVS